MKHTVLFLAAILVLAGCADQPTIPRSTSRQTTNSVSAAGAQLGPMAERHSFSTSTLKDLAALRRATAQFHRLGAAWHAGYAVPVSLPNSDPPVYCLDMQPLGAMGVHYLNTSLVTANPVVTQPQLVIYEPEKNGQMRLVGVEYIIPYGILARDAAPPELFGQQFQHNDVFGLWILHAWVWRHNPAGMFATWNPKVTCRFARPVPPGPPVPAP